MADGTLLPVAASNGDTINNETVVSGAAPVGQKMAVTKIHTGAHGVDGDSVTQTNPLDVRVGTGVAGQALPTMDAAARAGFVKPTDGTNVPAVKPASTAAQATDPAMVVAMSPNSPMAQGTPAAVASAWPVEVTDGTNVLGTSAHPVRTDPVGTTTQPVSAAALPLPAGAATSAKQPALGTAGTPSADVISVQGVAGGTGLPVSVTTGLQSPTGTPTSVPSSAGDGVILAANANRKGACIYNDSTQVLYLLLANAVSSAAVYTNQIAPGGYYEVPFGYTGVLKGIWGAANGNARVTEFT